MALRFLLHPIRMTITKREITINSGWGVKRRAAISASGDITCTTLWNQYAGPSKTKNLTVV